MSTVTESRSSINYETLQESLDAGGKGSNQQYETPPDLARELMARLPISHPATIFDPQAASGSLVNCTTGWPLKYGIEIDHEKMPGGVQIITGNCLKCFEIIEELMPDLRFVVGNCNPPFGVSWKTKDGDRIDSTLATWNFIKQHADQGFFIGSANTIEKFGIHQDAAVEIKSYERRQASQYWKGLRDTLEIGIVIWQRRDANSGKATPPGALSAFWQKLKGIMDEEKLSRPPWNIYVTANGTIKTYLSQRGVYKYKLTPQEVLKLSSLNDAHPAALCVEIETRRLLEEFISAGIYTLQPEAREAIEKALRESDQISVPIMPCSNFESVAYADHLDRLTCIKSATEINGVAASFTSGCAYAVRTGSYAFKEHFQRNKVHFNDESQTTYTKSHECVLSGTDRFIEIKDDHARPLRFMDRPRAEQSLELPENLLWEYFQQPVVKTVAEASSEQVASNQAILKACEMLAGFQYYPGQLEYLSRLAVKDCALIAAAVGAGKSLFAISMLAMKSPQRALIIAPQGTMRASKIEDDDLDEEQMEEMSAAQWFREIQTFAPYLQVFELFSHDDYLRLLALNGGKLPYGAFVTYPEAWFMNGAMEQTPQTWNDERLNQWAKSRELAELEPEKGAAPMLSRHWCDSIGKEVEGVRCVAMPCLSTLIGDQFDCVLVDEAHRFKSLDSVSTQMFIRMQPKYRYCLTATPVSNTCPDLFPLMGWLAVPEWYKGNRRNAAWPYAREDLTRFNSTFLTQERDLTQEEDNRQKDPRRRDKCIKASPIISSPARLLKLLKPNMAFISKEQCNPNYLKPNIIDVRVALGREQGKLYGFFTDRANIEGSNPLVRARKQTAYLRNICADPAGFTHGGPVVSSNMNPKVIAILELVRDILTRGEQVVIVNSRVGLTSTIISKLSEAGVPCARIDSTALAEQHAYQANRFKTGRARVLGIGLKCAAAFSFENCENLIISSLEFSAGTFVQACGRIDRVVNKVQKNIYCILHKNSLEEVMFETVALKHDAANLCLRGQRIARDFKPVDSSEILATALDRFSLDGSTPESECEQKWVKLCARLQSALGPQSLN